MKQKYEIIEANNFLEAIQNCELDKGYRILNSEEIWKLRNNKKIPNQWYDTSTIIFEGKFSNANMKVFKNWKNNFDKGMRSLILYDGDNGSYASGNFKDLYYSTRFVRVAVKNVKEVLYKK